MAEDNRDADHNRVGSRSHGAGLGPHVQGAQALESAVASAALRWRRPRPKLARPRPDALANAKAQADRMANAVASPRAAERARFLRSIVRRVPLSIVCMSARSETRVDTTVRCRWPFGSRAAMPIYFRCAGVGAVEPRITEACVLWPGLFALNRLDTVSRDADLVHARHHPLRVQSLKPRHAGREAQRRRRGQAAERQ